MANKSIVQQTAGARQEAQKQAVLEQLRQIPVIEIACKRADVSRPTLYRMRAADEKFRADIEAAIAEGVAFINDLSETALIGLIKDKHFASVRLWLQTHKPEYSRKVEVSGMIGVETNEFTHEERDIVKEALRRAFPQKVENKKNDGHGNNH